MPWKVKTRKKEEKGKGRKIVDVLLTFAENKYVEPICVFSELTHTVDVATSHKPVGQIAASPRVFNLISHCVRMPL